MLFGETWQEPVANVLQVDHADTEGCSSVPDQCAKLISKMAERQYEQNMMRIRRIFGRK